MKETLLELLEREQWPGNATILAEISDMDEVDIASAFDDLDNQKDIRLFRLLPKNIAADVFSYIVKDKQQELLETLSDREQGALINDLFADDAADLIEEMPAKVVTKLLKNANAETRQNINNLLKYPDGSAGSIMTVEYVRLKENQQVSEVFDIIRQHGVDKETIYTCYVVDAKRTLIGVVSVKDLLLAKPDAKIKDIMKEHPTSAHTTDSQEAVADIFRKYGHISIPVVDSEEKLVGIVTVDDVLQIIAEQHTEDIHRMAGVKTSENPYIKTSVLRHSRNRIVWLFILMVSAMVTGGIISAFETQLAAVPMLIAFIPMLMGTGGNAGSQTSTQIVRGMALGEIPKGYVLKIWWKEIRVALIIGVGLGIFNFLRIILLEGLILSGSVTGEIAKIAMVVTFSLCCTIVMAKSLGCLLPMLAKKLKFDPAIMAAPLIASILDTLSLLVYFGFAAMILHIA